MQPFHDGGVTLEIAINGRWRYDRPTPAFRTIAKALRVSGNPGSFVLTLHGVTPNPHEGPFPHVTSEFDTENRAVKLVVRTGRAPGDGIVCSIKLPKTRFDEPRTFVTCFARATERLSQVGWKEGDLRDTSSPEEVVGEGAGPSMNQLGTQALMRYTARSYCPPDRQGDVLPQGEPNLPSGGETPQAPVAKPSDQSTAVPKSQPTRTKRQTNSRVATSPRQREEPLLSRGAIVSQLKTCVVRLRREKATIGRERMRVVELGKALEYVSGVLSSDPNLGSVLSHRVTNAIQLGKRDFEARAHNLAREIKLIEQGILTATEAIEVLKKTFEDFIKS